MSTENIPTLTRTPSAWVIPIELQNTVDKLAEQDPARHRLAQEFGNFLLDHHQFSQLDDFRVNQQDTTGDELLYREIIKGITYQGFTVEDLSPHEISILKVQLGEKWNNIFIQ